MNQQVDWRAEAAKLRFRDKAFIDGAFVPALSGKTSTNISPIDGRVLSQVAMCEAEDVDRAVKSARLAFEKAVWSGQAPRQRKRVLVALAELISRNATELALLETLDMGKPIRDARGDIAAVADCVRWYGEAIDKL